MNFKKNLIVVIALIICITAPVNVFSVGNASVGGAAGAAFGNTASDAWNDATASMAGLRFTFVDNDGNIIPGTVSFDFIAWSKYSGVDFLYDNTVGNKSKIQRKSASDINFSVVNMPSALHRMSEVRDRFIDNLRGTGLDNDKNLAYRYAKDIKTTHFSKGYVFDSYKNWFISLTTNEIDLASATINVRAFVNALVLTYDAGSASSVIAALQTQSCDQNRDIYILMEPLINIQYYADGKWKDKFFGTPSDVAWALINLADGGYWNHFDRASRALYYDTNINGKFTAIMPTSEQTKDPNAILYSNLGFAVNIDWIQPNQFCSECKFNPDNSLSLKNEKRPLYNSPNPKFKNLGEYAFASKADGGAGCCLSISKGNVPTDYVDEYEALCKTSIQESGCKIENGKYYCLDGKRCSAAQYKNECVPDCCTDDPINSEPEKSINNCCADGTNSWVKEPELDKLFCDTLDDDGNKIAEKNDPKCKTDGYLDKKINNYCEMYCSEELSVDLPGAITAVSGRYFELEPTKIKDIKNPNSSLFDKKYTHSEDGKEYYINSPYIQGNRSCRILTDYDSWYKEYNKTVNEAISAYNSYQKAIAEYEAFAEGNVENDYPKTSQSVTGNYSCSASCTIKVPKETTTVASGTTTTSTTTGYDDKTISTSASGTCTVKYTRYEMKDEKTWYSIKKSQNGYKSLGITKDSSGSTNVFNNGNNLSLYDDVDTSDCNKKSGNVEITDKSKEQGGYGTGKKCTGTWSCSNTKTISGTNVDVSKKRSEKLNTANSYKTAYTNAVNKIIKLEEFMGQCNNYFDSFKTSEAIEQNVYKLTPELGFKYSQVYMNEKGELEKATPEVNWGNRKCTFTGPYKAGNANLDADGGIKPNRYSESYKIDGDNDKGNYATNVFKKEIGYQTSEDGYKDYTESFTANRNSTHDAQYQAQCYWEEAPNTVNTLVPSGAASETTSKMNYTKHERVYYVYLTTFDGTYETYWDLSGLGTKGHFDTAFKDSNGNTCSNRPVNNEDGNMTCTLHVEYEVVLTGRCNGSNGSGITTNPGDCTPQKEGMNLFNFRIVDPANIFPSGVTVKENGVTKRIAHNWRKITKKDSNPEKDVFVWVNAKKEIEDRAAKDETFNPKYLSYSFILTPTDMGHIKNYNTTRIDDGGYSDFEMKCNCDNEVPGACVKCKSIFITELANGNVKYDRVNHSVSGWANPKNSLTKVRENNRW